MGPCWALPLGRTHILTKMHKARRCVAKATRCEAIRMCTGPDALRGRVTDNMNIHA